MKEELMNQARAVRANAYAPYSHFPVGCAILMNDEKVITGVNVENVSYGATNCAERSALFSAISQGYPPYSVQAIAISGQTEDFLPPCSLCRQVMVELCHPDTKVYLTRNDGDIYTTTVADLVPLSFNTMN